jgi:alpha-tubulin suppressor-like RCC1 family protein
MSCAISNQSVRCYGRETGADLQLTGIADGVLSPEQVSVGIGHACVIETSGRLLCWGYNAYGQIGSGTTERAFKPVAVLERVVSVDLGRNHTCAVTSEGLLYCWGDNRYGAVGTRTAGSFVAKPSLVNGLEHVREVAAGADFTCAQTVDDKIWCWGRNDSGQLGVPLEVESMRAGPTLPLIFQPSQG